MSARAIVKQLGGMWCGSCGLVRCPAHDDRNPSLKVRDDPNKRDGIDLICFAGCDWRDVKEELQRQGLLPDSDSRENRVHHSASTAGSITQVSDRKPKLSIDDDADIERRIEYALKLWQQSVPLTDTLGRRYFVERRSLHIGLLDDLSHALRWHDGEQAVIGLMTNVTNKPTGIHRTFLNPDGTKRERKMLGKAGVIRLSPDEDVTHGLGLTRCRGWPCCSLIGMGAGMGGKLCRGNQEFPRPRRHREPDHLCRLRRSRK
jgi:putative DNA primase/helicase